VRELVKRGFPEQRSITWLNGSRSSQESHLAPEARGVFLAVRSLSRRQQVKWPAVPDRPQRIASAENFGVDRRYYARRYQRLGSPSPSWQPEAPVRLITSTATIGTGSEDDITERFRLLDR
jgi:hypothetical protein